MTWHKAQAQPSYGVASRPHHLGRPAMCWCISRNYFVNVSRRAVLKVSNAQRWCKKETWPAGLTSGHRLNPPINTLVLPPGRKCESEV
jgi:hypothetical protein